MSDSGFAGILKGASVVGAGAVVSKAITFVAEVTIAARLPPSVFGAAMFAYTLLLTVAVMLLAGVPQGFAHRIPRDDAGGNAERVFQTVLVGTALVLVLAVAVAGVVLVLPRSLVARVGPADAHGWLLPLAPLVVAYPVSRLSFGVMRAFDRSLPRALSDDVLNKLLAGGALLVALHLGHERTGFVAFYLGQYLLSGLFAAWAAVRILRSQLDRSALSLRGIGGSTRSLLSYSWPLALKGFLWILLSNVGLLLVGLFLTSAAVGRYRVGFVLSELGVVTLTSLGYLYTPRLSRRYAAGDLATVRRRYRQTTVGATLLFLPVGLTLFHYAETLVGTLFGAAYLPAAVVLRIAVVDMVLRNWTGVAGSTLRAAGRTRTEFLTTVVAVAATLALLVALVPAFGIAGAAVGTLAGMLVAHGLQVAAVYRYDGIHPFDGRHAAAVLVTVAASVPLARAADTLLPTRLTVVGLPLSLVAFAAVVVALEAAVVWVSGTLAPAEKRRVRAAVRDRLP